MSTGSDPGGGGLTPSERFLLYVLDREFDSGRVRQRDLVEETALEPSTTTEAIGRLTDRGLVDHRPDPMDGRRKVVERLG